MSPNSKSSMPKTIKTERKSETTVKSKNIDATSVDAGNNPVKEFQSSRDVIEKKIDAFFEANKDAGIRKLVSATKLMEAGAHIGTYARYSNPKMKPFVYPKRAGKSLVIDILKTLVYLDRAYQFLRDITKDGARVLFVGTRGDVIKEHVKNEAKRVQSFYVNQRWLGGTLTNFKTISKSIEKLNNLIALQLSDEIKKYSKKEQLMIGKEAQKMSKFLGGIRTMRGLPQAIVITDPVIEHNALAEAKHLKIPVVAFASTNANPDEIDFLIPANSMSVRTVYLLLSILCDAIAEANDQPLSIVGKKDEEIVLPEIAKKVQTASFISHKRFGRNLHGSTSSSTAPESTTKS